MPAQQIIFNSMMGLQFHLRTRSTIFGAQNLMSCIESSSLTATLDRKTCLVHKNLHAVSCNPEEEHCHDPFFHRFSLRLHLGRHQAIQILLATILVRPCFVTSLFLGTSTCPYEPWSKVLVQSRLAFSKDPIERLCRIPLQGNLAMACMTDLF